MRISLLLEREPFPGILEDTLKHYWSETLSQVHAVSWSRSVLPRIGRERGQQAWFVNTYLNSIFLPSARPGVFEPIRAEFSHSLAAWRRPLQKAYVRAALTPPGSSVLSQAVLLVSPPIPRAEYLLIISGNHKIRVVEPLARRCTTILKAGFPRQYMEAELESRLLAGRLNLPVPLVEVVADDRTWYREQYVCGVPLNRLRDPDQASASRGVALSAVRKLVEATLSSAGVSEYLYGLRESVGRYIGEIGLLSSYQKTKLNLLTDRLYREAGGSSRSKGQRVWISRTHGDFQPGNILLEDGRTWLVDWEYSAERQAPYDLLTLLCGARQPHGLAERLWNFERNPHPLAIRIPPDWPGWDVRDQQARHRLIGIFLLEELCFHLRENRNPLFHRLGRGLRSIQAEIARWLKIAGTVPNS